MEWIEGYLAAMRQFSLVEAAKGSTFAEVLSAIGALLSPVVALCALWTTMRSSDQMRADRNTDRKLKMISDAYEIDEDFQTDLDEIEPHISSYIALALLYPNPSDGRLDYDAHKSRSDTLVEWKTAITKERAELVAAVNNVFDSPSDTSLSRLSYTVLTSRSEQKRLRKKYQINVEVLKANQEVMWRSANVGATPR